MGIIKVKIWTNHVLDAHQDVLNAQKIHVNLANKDIFSTKMGYAKFAI